MAFRKNVTPVDRVWFRILIASFLAEETKTDTAVTNKDEGRATCEGSMD